MSNLAFKKAEKMQAKLRLALTGPSGSGKTYSALEIAKGIGKKIAFIDTENHSASLYADDFSFDTLEIEPPYTIDKYIEAMQMAVNAGYDVLIVDSISHAWAGEGGLLEKKGALDVRGGNSYTNWAPVTKEHEHFKAMLLNIDIHLIVTMRSKQDYVLEINDKGKSSPRKVGLAPIQRDGMEYEFTLVLDMGMDHSASVSKTRIKGFDGKLFKPSTETGKELLTWLMSGSKLEVAKVPVKLEVAQHQEVAEHANEENEHQEAYFVPLDIKAFVSKKNGAPYFKVMDPEGALYTTFSKSVAEMAKEAKEKNEKIHVQFSVSEQYGAKIESVGAL